MRCSDSKKAERSLWRVGQIKRPSMGPQLSKKEMPRNPRPSPQSKGKNAEAANKREEQRTSKSEADVQEGAKQSAAAWGLHFV